MGFMDKLKNIFFEEEEEEEIEEKLPPKKEKEKEKDRESEKVKPREKLTEVIAKKVEIPKRNKEEKKEEKKEFEEIKEEIVSEVKAPVEIKEEVKEIKKEEVRVLPKRETKINSELIFDDDDFILDTKTRSRSNEETTKKKSIVYKPKEIKEIKKEEVKVVSKPLYQNSAEVKPKSFTPSPIISPIYGILDKNYKKEEVKENKEIRLSTRPSRVDLDSVRNKAFGDLEYDLFGSDDIDEEKEEVKEKKANREKREIKKVESEEEKPIIERVTLGEADEYYNDLGLAYNTDYKDLSKDLSDGKVTEKKKEDKLEDNLFDLIESMYDKEE